MVRKERRQAARELFAWLSFFVFLGCSLFFGFVPVFDVLPARLGVVDTKGFIGLLQGLWLLGAALLVFVVCVYLGAIAWLLFARLFFSKVEVFRIVCAGPTTRFDRWLVEFLFR